MRKGKGDGMNDLISRRAVLAALTDISYNHCKTEGEAIVIDTAKTLVTVMPSAQPEPCEDVVSREYLTEHIEACWMNGRMSKPDLNDVLSWINDIPSAQPEIIRCRDCRKYRKFDCPMGITVFDAPDLDGYCYKAERRTDGTEQP